MLKYLLEVYAQMMNHSNSNSNSCMYNINLQYYVSAGNFLHATPSLVIVMLTACLFALQSIGFVIKNKTKGDFFFF